MDRKTLIGRLNGEGGGFPSADELLGYAKSNTSTGYRGRYNLACYYSELAGRELAQTSNMVKRLEETAEALEEASDLAGQSGQIFDAVVEEAAAELYEVAATEIAVEGDDNVSSTLDNALRCLKIALNEAPGTGLGDWANVDPSLETLRKDPKYGPDFYGLIWETTDPSPLSEVESIGPERARKLAVMGIMSADGLAKALADKGNWGNLAKQLGANSEDLAAWLRVATLMREIHASPVETTLLNDVGVRSVDDLLARSPFPLALDLDAANKVMKRTDTPPDEKRVRGWMVLARA